MKDIVKVIPTPTKYTGTIQLNYNGVTSDELHHIRRQLNRLVFEVPNISYQSFCTDRMPTNAYDDETRHSQSVSED